MDEFGQTSLLMLAASIGSADPWMMAASSGAVTLTPYRMMSVNERLESIEQCVLLRLTDLGHLGSTVDGRPLLAPSPLRSRSEVVLLLPWSLLSTISELDVVARTSSREIPRCYAPEDWLTAWHHYVDGADWCPLVLEDDISRRADMLSNLPFTGMRHFILATRSSVNSVRDSHHRLAGHALVDGAGGRDRNSPAIDQALRTLA
jgi:hypothetical protein